MGLEAAEHVAGLGVEGDDGLVSVIVLVDKTIRLDCGLQLQIHAVDVDIFFVSNEIGIDIDVQTEAEMVVVTRYINASRASVLDGHKALVGQCA